MRGSQLGVLPCVPRPVQTDDFSAGKRLYWSKNSGAFMEGSEESCSNDHGPREAGPACAHSYFPTHVLLKLNKFNFSIFFD